MFVSCAECVLWFYVWMVDSFCALTVSYREWSTFLSNIEVIAFLCWVCVLWSLILYVVGWWLLYAHILWWVVAKMRNKHYLLKQLLNINKALHVTNWQCTIKSSKYLGLSGYISIAYIYILWPSAVEIAVSQQGKSCLT